MSTPQSIRSTEGLNDVRYETSTERWKLSSSDLHSRLKTRKVLGVGETDDGDVHRSKLSQILGHSDQLYVRLPWGLRTWQLVLAVTFTVVSLWALVLPSHLFDVTFQTEEGKYVTLPVRLYGVALLALAIFHWNCLYATDRDVIRMSLLSSAVYFTLQTAVTFVSVATWDGVRQHVSWLQAMRLSSALISGLFYHTVGCKCVSLKKANKDASSD